MYITPFLVDCSLGFCLSDPVSKHPVMNSLRYMMENVLLFVGENDVM